MTESLMRIFTMKTAVCIMSACILLSSLISADPPDTGYIRVYIFSEGRPVRGVSVRIAGTSETSNANGVAVLRAEPGKHSFMVWPSGKQPSEFSVSVTAGAVTEVIVTLKAQGAAPDVEIEAPEDRGREVEKEEGPSGILSGTVTDAEQNRPVAGAKIYIAGLLEEASTDDSGVFSISIPAGKHTVSIIHPEYVTETVKNLEIKSESTKNISVSMDPSSVMLSTVDIIVPKLAVTEKFTIEQEALSTVDLIGADDFARSGDSDAADALKRATGLTVVGGRFVYVRGMGERYSSSLMNGATLPSPEPERRVVPLNLFPVAVIEKIIIQKTYTPDMPGEFGGGAVQLETKGMADEFFISVSASLGYSSLTTDLMGYTYDGGGFHDTVGIDDGTRGMPDSLKKAVDNKPLYLGNYDKDELERFGESLQNVWSAERENIPMNRGLSFSAGNRFEIGGKPAGFLFGFTYGNSWETREMVYRDFAGGGSYNEIVDYEIDSTVNTIDAGAVFTAACELSDEENIELTTLLVRTTKDSASVTEGFYEANNTDVLITKLHWLEQQLFSNTVQGKHTLPGTSDTEFEWNYTRSIASRYEPDKRQTMYEYEESEDDWYLSDRTAGNMRTFNELKDHNFDVDWAFTFPVEIYNTREMDIKVGMNSVFRNRHSAINRFRFFHKDGASVDPDVMRLDPENIFTPENIAGIGETGFLFEEHSVGTDDYTATHEIRAPYFRLDIPITGTFNFSGGMRIETSQQVVETFELSSPTKTPVSAELVTKDRLPALNFTWGLVQDIKGNDIMNLRFGYSRTLSRPDFRELSEAPYETVVGGRMIKGNSELERALIDNFDVRWELYLSADENLSVALFYKELTNPIEVTILSGSNSFVTYHNAAGATNIGLECEYRKNLSCITERLKDLYLGGNVAVIRSSVDVGDEAGVVTEEERPLQGQSPYVINISLSYENPESNLAATLLYNVYGKRIAAIGTYGLPDVYEQPFNQVDFVASWEFLEDWKVKAKIKNILEEDMVLKQGDYVKESYQKGMGISIGLSAAF